MHCHIIWHVDGGLALQWLERPDEVSDKYYSSSFKSECAAEASYEALDKDNVHTTGSSGLKARSDYSDSMMHGEVVRRHMDTFAKRGLGDGYKARGHFGRR